MGEQASHTLNAPAAKDAGTARWSQFCLSQDEQAAAESKKRPPAGVWSAGAAESDTTAPQQCQSGKRRTIEYKGMEFSNVAPRSPRGPPDVVEQRHFQSAATAATSQVRKGWARFVDD